MLRISKKADYAVFLLGAIARQGAYPGGSLAAGVVSAHEIARQAGLNKSVVANLLKEFTKHGILDSVRGLKGGYRLAKPPRDITLGAILTVVEGPFTLVDCIEEHELASSSLLPLARQSQSSGSSCSLIAFCPSKQPMRIVHERISQLFHQIRLDELCGLEPCHPVVGSPAAPALGTPACGDASIASKTSPVNRT